MFFDFSDFFFVIRTEDSILLNLNPNGHIVEAKLEISIIQSNIVDEQLTAIFGQILLSTVHKQSFCLKDCFTVRDGFFLFEHLFFCFCSTVGDALIPLLTYYASHKYLYLTKHLFSIFLNSRLGGDLIESNIPIGLISSSSYFNWTV